MTTNHWTEYLRRAGACAEAVTWARSYDSVDAAWDACEWSDWMLWLVDRCSLMTAPAWEEYERVRAAAREEYERVAAPAWAKYQRVTAPAWAKYQRVTAPALAEYQRVTAPALAEYQRVTAPAWAKYQRVTAAALRRLATRPTLAMLRAYSHA